MGCCFAPDCSHTNKSGCKMYRFPMDQATVKKWEQLIRPADSKANKHSKVCSCHFENGLKKNGPTIFKRNQQKVFSFPSLDKKKPRIIKSNTEQGEMSTLSLQETVTPDNPNPCKSCKDHKVNNSAMLEADNYFLKKEVEELTEKVKNMKIGFLFEIIETNDELISMYTGLPYGKIVMCLFNYLEKLKICYYAGWVVEKMQKRDQVLMTLMKLKLNLPNKDLALRFNCLTATVSNVILTWIHVLHTAVFEKFTVNNVPSTTKTKTCFLPAFSPFTTCSMVLDCTEVYTEVPNQLNKQRFTYSNYKSRNTLKALVGVAPNGVITFVSDLYVGSTSDKKIVECCGVLSIFKPGDLILGDKGFLISDLLPAGVSLNILPFLMTAQYTPEEVRQTTAILKARIHVERAIKKIKCYKILTIIPATSRVYSSKVFQVCAALRNLQYALIKEVEGMYTVE